jgi:peroxiredoxin
MQFVSANELAQNIQQDPGYKSADLKNVVRKWAGALGIRYVILGEMGVMRENAIVSMFIVDALVDYPIPHIIENPQLEMIDEQVTNHIENIFKNIQVERKNAIMRHMQTKWMKARQEMIGKPAPPLDLPNVLTDERFKLRDQRGDVIFVHFFSIECEHCEEEMEWVSEIVSKMPHVKAYGISVDVGEADSVRAYVESKNLDYPILLPSEDESAQLDEYYGGATPQSVIIDDKGIVREITVGFNKAITDRFTKMLEEMAKQE